MDEYLGPRPPVVVDRWPGDRVEPELVRPLDVKSEPVSDDDAAADTQRVCLGDSDAETGTVNFNMSASESPLCERMRMCPRPTEYLADKRHRNLNILKEEQRLEEERRILAKSAKES